MSQINTNTIKDASGGNTATINGMTPTATSLQGFRNRLLNGGMSIDQRNAGAAQTITAAAALAYTVDRWYAYCTGANVTGQQVAGAGANQYRYRFTGAASVTKIGFAQRIESFNSYDLNNTTATLSVDLANSVLTTVTWVASYANTADTFGSLASPTVTQIATGTFTVNSAVTNYSTTISIPAAATTGIQIEFSVGAQTSGTWTIGNVQLEAGSVATPFERRPYGTELALCQRYYQKSYSQTVTPGTATLVGCTVAAFPVAGTGVLELTSFLKTEMRTPPTVTLYDGLGSAGAVYRQGNGATGAVEFVSTASFAGYSASGASALNLAYQWTASAEL